jgi:glutathione synthase/RimK-type ligase-like ATP-grasp enzyme
MILILTHRFDPHADLVIRALESMNAKYFRINWDDYPKRICLRLTTDQLRSAAQLRYADKTLSAEDIRVVWVRRRPVFDIHEEVGDPQYRQFAEDQCRATFDGFCLFLEAFWVSHPWSIAKAERKFYQLDIARQVGLDIPRSLVTNNETEARSFCTMLWERNAGVIAKMLGSSSAAAVHTTQVLPQHNDSFTLARYAPVLFQELVPKACDIRIVIFGDRLFSVAIDSQANPNTQIDWRRAGFRDLVHTAVALPSDLASKCRGLLKRLNLNFGAIDMARRPDGRYTFFEVNPVGQWLWLEDFCNLSISSELAAFLYEHDVPVEGAG